ncbi:type II secretion system protein [Actinomadura sp. NBRC 104425]|uniref:type II secretion system F family protein n=1 Tax=Actinomadura sp. NBRC 104425 TaxID=3032204 RepID=UPI0024A38951|nr:type II secretion system F family protein [Actinomadura sp. NBRC 104425]GLZ15879.1 type II secretion system protein [Actinomadura sp. NBRC 104425]
MVLLAACAGMCVAAAALSIIAGLIGAPPGRRDGRPPSRLQVVLRSAVRPERRNRLLTATGAALAVLLALRWPVAAIAVGAAVYALPPMLSGRAPTRQIAKLDAMAQWARRLAEMMGASRGLEQALADSARVAPAAIREPVGMLADRLNNHAATEQALRAFADDLDDPVGDLIACALILAAKRRGPGTRQALSLLADAVEHEVLVRRDVEAERASLRTTLLVIVLSVGALSALFVSSQTLAEPYGTPLGQAVLGVVAAIYAVGLWWMRRLSVLSTGSRFLHARHPSPARERGAAS